MQRFEGNVEKHFELLGVPVPEGLESIEMTFDNYRSDVTEDESIEEIAHVLMNKRPKRPPKEGDEPAPELEFIDRVTIFGEVFVVYSREEIR